MRFLIVFFALALTAPSAFAQQSSQQPQEIFRHFVWGATKSDVISYEKAQFYKSEENSTYYIETLPKQDFRRLIRYDFKEGKLWRGFYEIQDLTYPDPAKVLNLYEDMKRELIGLYGKPSQDLYTWKNKKYFDYPEFWGRALRSGDLKPSTHWDLADSTVVLELSRQDPYYSLQYTAQKKGEDAPVENPQLIFSDTP